MPATSVALSGALFGAFFGALLLGCGTHGPSAPVEAELAVHVNDWNALPGAQPLDAATSAKLDVAWDALPSGYEPRTRHLQADGAPTYTNRLLLEASPYLRQHAHNPVNWYPWGDEAFAEAARLGRPVLLSVGYSTCHWCHVMEEESFEDEEIARYLNEHYIAVKVDREERPDVDSIYMTAVHLMQGRGGWPMTVWLTPDRLPFHAATYIPPRDGDRGTRYGFLTILGRLEEAFRTRRAEVDEVAGRVAEGIRSNLEPAPQRVEAVDADAVLSRAAQHFSQRFDPVWGGLSGAPKFPSSLPARALLRVHRRTGDAQVLQMATLSLEKMAAGGMYDHVAGGFHRYSTDARWLVPHFEKMLYDNALLVPAYLDAFQVTGRQDFARVAREVLDYVERDMRAADGAFYSATDADSIGPDGEREEGYYFTWTPPELDAALGADDSRVVQAWYGVTPEGNFEGRTILNTPRSKAAVASELGISEEQLDTVIARARETLYAVRGERPAPLRDEKILTAWNGLMISAFARAALVLNEPRYAELATQAAESLLGNARLDGDRLLRSRKDDVPGPTGLLDDYAFFSQGLVDLFEATGQVRYLAQAQAFDRVLASHFEDGERGGWFLTPSDGEVLLAREKPSRDGAEPSGNSVHALTLLRLAELTGDDAYRARAARAMQALGDVLTSSPAALSEMLLAVDFDHGAAEEIVLVTPGSRDQAEPLLATWRERFLPSSVLVVVEESQVATVAETLPIVSGKLALGGAPTAYVCERGLCKLPVTEPDAFAAQLDAD